MIRRSKAARPALLFTSPTIPALTGSGIAMRAGMMLEALAADHDVHLLVLPVVLYLPSLAYARRVLERMVAKARRGVMVLDVPDLARREQALAFRRGFMGREEYERKYDGLDHLYFSRSWFETTLAGLGVSRVRIDDQRIEEYGNAPYRFNVFAWPARS